VCHDMCACLGHLEQTFPSRDKGWTTKSTHITIGALACGASRTQRSVGVPLGGIVPRTIWAEEVPWFNIRATIGTLIIETPRSGTQEQLAHTYGEVPWPLHMHQGHLTTITAKGDYLDTALRNPTGYTTNTRLAHLPPGSSCCGARAGQWVDCQNSKRGQGMPGEPE
jgi:hypothetical protein